MKTTTLLILALAALSLPAADKPASNEAQTKVHRLATPYRSPFDAFVYVNRIPDKAEQDETPAEFAGRIFGRLANQEGRIQLKLPAGMDRNAYHGMKTFLGSEGDARVSNCVTCHAPPEFTDGKGHVVAHGQEPRLTPSLRNLAARKLDLEKLLVDKLAAIRQKQSGKADDIDDAYSLVACTQADVPNLVAFLRTLDDVPDEDFRNIILQSIVLDTSQEAESQPAAAAGLTGTVRFDGEPPKRRKIFFNPETAPLYKFHKGELLDEVILVGENGGLANAFVHVKKGVEKKNFPMPTGPALLDQAGLMFRPRVQGVRVGQEFVTRNSDPVVHSVRTISVKNRSFNNVHAPQSEDRIHTFKHVEKPIHVANSFQKWMSAFVFVMDHPFFAVTDAQGRFKIEGLPPGEYTLEAWHEELGEQQTTITVGSNGTAQADFTFKAKTP